MKRHQTQVLTVRDERRQWYIKACHLLCHTVPGTEYYKSTVYMYKQLWMLCLITRGSSRNVSLLAAIQGQLNIQLSVAIHVRKIRCSAVNGNSYIFAPANTNIVFYSTRLHDPGRSSGVLDRKSSLRAPCTRNSWFYTYVLPSLLFCLLQITTPYTHGHDFLPSVYNLVISTVQQPRDVWYRYLYTCFPSWPTLHRTDVQYTNTWPISTISCPTTDAPVLRAS